MADTSGTTATKEQKGFYRNACPERSRRECKGCKKRSGAGLKPAFLASAVIYTEA